MDAVCWEGNSIKKKKRVELIPIMQWKTRVGRVEREGGWIVPDLRKRVRVYLLSDCVYAFFFTFGFLAFLAFGICLGCTFGFPVIFFSISFLKKQSKRQLFRNEESMGV